MIAPGQPHPQTWSARGNRCCLLLWALTAFFLDKKTRSLLSLRSGTSRKPPRLLPHVSVGPSGRSNIGPQQLAPVSQRC